eukprot:g29883.t1
MRPRRNEQSRPPAQYLHKAVLLAISDASTERLLPAFGGEEVYFGGLVPSEQQLIQVAGSYIWGQVVFSLPVLEERRYELLQSGALELAPGVRVHEVMSAPRTSRWAAAGGRLESINDAAAALLGDDQQRHWYQRYLGLSRLDFGFPAVSPTKHDRHRQPAPALPIFTVETMATPCEEEASLSACAACKAEGNTAYANGDLETAREHYAAALEHWEAALRPAPSAHEIGARVRYSRHGFGVVMSAFTMFDEYFLKE